MNGATLLQVRSRGALRTGVSLGIPGLPAPAGTTWEGFDADIARAVAAAALDGDPAVEFVPLPPNERLAALEQKRVDVVTANATWTQRREGEHPVTFAGISLYDGETALVPVAAPIRRVLDLDQRRVAVQKGTTTAQNLERALSPTGGSASVEEYSTPAEAAAAYARGECEAYVLDSVALAGERLALPDPDGHRLLDQRLSKEPMGPVVRDDDADWFKFVRWVLLGLVWAEEEGLGQAQVHAPADLARRPLAPQWLCQAVSAVGNYGEVFARNLGDRSPLQLPRGPNDLWSRGGLLYAPPL